MSNITEIEAAIEKLPDPQVEQLAHWLETLRQRRAKRPPVESWLQRARGAAIPGARTKDVMALTRGEE
jgi:cytochrome c553